MSRGENQESEDTYRELEAAARKHGLTLPPRQSRIKTTNVEMKIIDLAEISAAYLLAILNNNNAVASNILEGIANSMFDLGVVGTPNEAVSLLATKTKKSTDHNEVTDASEVTDLGEFTDSGEAMSRFRQKAYQMIERGASKHAAYLFEAVSSFVFISTTNASTFMVVREGLHDLGVRAGLAGIKFDEFVGALADEDIENKDVYEDFMRWVREYFSKPLLFISYCEADQNLVTTLSREIDSIGFKSFVAHRDLPPGARWGDELRAALHRAVEVLVILSPHALQSSWVTIELGAAWMLRKQITPLLKNIDSNDIPELARDFQAWDISEIPRFEGLQEALRKRHLP